MSDAQARPATAELTWKVKLPSPLFRELSSSAKVPTAAGWEAVVSRNSRTAAAVLGGDGGDGHKYDDDHHHDYDHDRDHNGGSTLARTAVARMATTTRAECHMRSA